MNYITWFKLQLDSKFEMLELGENDMILYLKAEIIKVA